MTAALVAPLVPAGAAQAAPSVNNCWLYVPSPISVNVASPVPGQSITITGTAGANEVVSIVIRRTEFAPIVSTTATTNVSGAYSRTVTLPTTAPPGLYQVIVTSPFCGTATLVINIRYADNRCTGYRTAQVTRPLSSSWQLLGIFNWSQNVTVTLIPEAGGPNIVIRPAAIASPGLTFTYGTNLAMAPGWYTVSEVGRSPVAPVNRVANCGRLKLL